jgi:membrane fusion protein (multidrug efflux system)
MRVFIISLVIGMALWNCTSKEVAETKKVQVQVVAPKRKDLVQNSEFVGYTMGKSDIQVVARVEGTILKVHFRDGQTVKQGQLLYTIDPVLQDNNVNRFRGELEAAKSDLVNAQAELNRIRPLAEQKAVSQKDLDAAIARVEVGKAKVSAANASLQNAATMRSYCDVTAPVSGVIGISAMQEGDYVTPLGERSKLNTISDIRDVRVRFSLSELEMLHIEKRYQQRNKQGASTNGNARVPIYLIRVDGTQYPFPGYVTSTDRAFDVNTSTMALEATFPNAEGLLIPGQNVRLRVPLDTLKGSIVLPRRAVREVQGVFQVYCLDKDNKLQVKVVKPGLEQDEEIAIVEGLNGDERVAILGSLFLKIGMPVEPVMVSTDSLK